MNGKLREVLSGQESNHLLPFLWMHDGHNEELPGLMKQVHDSGARAVCVESRPHHGFCRQAWWDDMDVILAEAKKLGMKVWILDDQHFPTGYANGLVREKYPHLRKWHLIEQHVDVIGPARENAILLKDPSQKDDDDDILLGVYAYQRNGAAEVLGDTAIDLTGNVHGRYVYWDIPEGVWRVFSLYKTRKGNAKKDYIHMIDRESCHVLIEAVYEPHYEHYKEYFGNTIAGFFSDEPSFGNCQAGKGTGTIDIYSQMLGQQGLALPWSEEVLERLDETLGGDALSKLAALWFPQGGKESGIRVAYMDAITSLWREHFSMQVGSWCRDHGVEYIGHVIEDMNCHARMNYGPGHFFRGLDGQDMAGLDVVLHQVIPGLNETIHSATLSGNAVDPEFFDYVLARLATSHSHIQPRMKGRVMCEIFGAFGWAEGLPFMRHLLDHMLVRGVNQFVPHAFSPRYPDPDCPPHFGAGGLNPQFSAFAKLMKYANQASHLLEGGVETVSAAILYHAEAEWSGQKYMLMQKPAKKLYDAQMNYDFLPIDAIMEKGRVQGGMLCVEEMRYPALVVPYAEYLPGAFLEKLMELEKQGLELVFIDGRPEGYEGGTVVKLDDVAGYIAGMGAGDVELSIPFPQLRVFHKKNEDSDVFMIVNESMNKVFDGEVILPVDIDGARLDLLMDEVSRIHGGKVHLKLGCGQSVILVYGGDVSGLSYKAEYDEGEEIRAQWMLSLKPALPGAEYGEAKVIDELYNVAGPEGDPSFSGWMKYETEFEVEEEVSAIDLGQVGEVVHAWLNGIDLGERVDAPYVYDVSRAVKAGKNHLALEIANNLVHQHMDYFSQFVQIAPSGLLGPVKLMY